MGPDTSIHNDATQSLSKKAIHLMNSTNGLCAHPIHYHSFTAVGSSSIFAPAAGVSLLTAPKCLFVGTFQKCIACHNRLGSRPQKNHNDIASNEDSSSGMEMLYCVACGVYAHRSCAFARDAGHIESLPKCEVNRPILEDALGFQSEKSPNREESKLSESPRYKSPWPFFGRKTVDGHDHTAPDDKALECLKSTNKETHCKQDTANNDAQEPSDVNNAISESHQHSNQQNSSWSFFRKSHPTKESTKESLQTCSNTNEIGFDSGHPQTWCPYISISRPESPVSWSIFGTKTSTCKHTADESSVETEHKKTKQSLPKNVDTQHDDDLRHNADQSFDKDDSIEIDDVMTHCALEDMLTADHGATDEVNIPAPHPQGAFKTSIEIIRKTSQTTSNIPKAYSIGMVAGGVAGLAIAGPAG